MKKLFAFILAALVLLSVSAANADAADAVISINGDTVSDGSIYTVINELPATVDFNGSGSTPTGAVDYAWSISGITLSDPTLESFPQDFSTAGTYTVDLTVAEQANSSITDDSTVTLEIVETDYDVLLQDGTLSVIQGQSGSVDLIMQNNGNVETPVSVAIKSQDPGLTLTLSTTDYNLAVNQQVVVPVTAAVINTAVPNTQLSGVVEATFGNGQTVEATVTVTVLQEPTGTSIDIPDSTITLGSDSARRETTVTETFTIQNTGATTLTDIGFTTTASGDYDVTFSPANVSSLAPLATQTVEVSVFIPDDQDSGTDLIGTMTVVASSGGSTVSDKADLELITKSELRIEDVEVELKEQDDDASLDDGDDFDARPGEEFDITINVENHFDDNVEIQDIEVGVESDDSDLDVDDSDDMSDLDDGKDDDTTFTFTVDSDLDDGDEFDIAIRVSGEDENGAMHEDEWTVTLIVERRNHFISIEEVSVRPTTVTCQLDATVDVRVENLGADDEDEVFIEVDSADLDYNEAARNLELDTDDDIDRSFRITWDEPLEEGTYFIDVTSYYDTSRTSDRETIELEALGCSDDEDQDEEDDDTIVVDDDFDTTTGGTDGTTGNVVFVDEEESNFTRVAYVVLLALAGILVIVVILVLLKKFLF